MATREMTVPEAGTGPGRDPRHDDQTLAGACTPTITRGGNVVVCRPPAPWYAAPAFTALAHKAGDPGLQLLVLAGEALVGPLARVAAGPWHDGKGTLLVVADPNQALALTRDALPTALVTTPEVAKGLLARSALPLGDTTTLLLAWPETWDDETPLIDLMADLPAAAQRILYSADHTRIDSLAERYLRKALVAGRPATDHPPVETVVEVAVAPSDRVGPAVADVLRGSAGASDGPVVVWVGSEDSEAVVREALLATPFDVEVSRGLVPEAALVIAADLPAPEMLAQLARQAGRLVVVTSPNGVPYLRAHASTLRPARGLSQPDSEAALARQRATIEEALAGDRADLDRAVHALAPLLERHDPPLVAAALYRLWTAKPIPAQPAARAARPVEAQKPSSGTVKIFVTAGKKDNAGPADFVACLTRELGVKREDIGRIEVRETFSLIELPAASAAGIAKRLDGASIRHRKVSARLERPRR